MTQPTNNTVPNDDPAAFIDEVLVSSHENNKLGTCYTCNACGEGWGTTQPGISETKKALLHWHNQEVLKAQRKVLRDLRDYESQAFKNGYNKNFDLSISNFIKNLTKQLEEGEK